MAKGFHLHPWTASSLDCYAICVRQASNFLDENDPHYAGLHGTRDTVARVNYGWMELERV